jgi:hypothetical protein
MKKSTMINGKVVGCNKISNNMIAAISARTFAALAIVAITALTGMKAATTGATEIWKLESPQQVGQYKPEILGNPAIVMEATGKALSFNGISDGLFIPKVPIEGWSNFTIEVLFKPSEDGPVAPRFIHFEDKELNRGTFELRLTNKGQWYMDTFLKNGKTNKGLTLIDSSLLHAANRWYWAALVYDGKSMSSYVDGKKELQGTIDFPAMTSGNIALGVRLNKVNWFKGLIREVRFHPAALDTAAMQHL